MSVDSEAKTSSVVSRKQILSMIVAIIVAIGGIAVANIQLPNSDYAPVLSVIFAIFPIVFGVFIFTYPLRSWVKKIMFIENTLSQIDNAKLRENMHYYAENTITTAALVMSQLKKGPTDLDGTQLERLMMIMFKTNARYLGIDFNLPSHFYGVYPKYLDAHAKSLSESTHQDKGYRVIAKNQDEIQEDSSHPLFSDFRAWHKKHKVRLTNASPTEINSILKTVGIEQDRCNNGVGYWEGEFAILFAKTGEKKKRKVEIVENTSSDFAKIKTLFSELEKKMSEISEMGAYRPIPVELASRWSSYAMPEKRLKIIKPFLYHFLEKYKNKSTILDTSAGIGIEFQQMSADGFWMDANEFQKEMIDAGKRYKVENEFELEYEPTSHDWRHLPKFFRRERYGAILVIGNCLRVLPSSGGQKDSISAFFKLLMPGGTMIIDERNFEYLKQHGKEIEKCENEPDSQQAFKELKNVMHIPNPMYQGTSIKTVPHSLNLDNNSVSFRYYPADEDVTNMNNALRHSINEWEFSHFVEMTDLLKSAGFKDIKKYADYDLNKEVLDDDHVDDTAIFVYVATK